MIEVPRGALRAHEIARVAEFFSFGTNDLTQTVFGISRDDSGIFLPAYLEAKIWEHDPFDRLDQVGVGQLMKWLWQRAAPLGRTSRSAYAGNTGGSPPPWNSATVSG